MLPEQENLIYDNFAELVRDCDLERVIKSLSKQDTSGVVLLDNIKIEDDRRHNNRCILFQILKSDSVTLFEQLVQSLRDLKFHQVADKLENKASTSPFHRNCYFRYPNYTVVNNERLNVNVKIATKFCDMKDCYKTRSRNRGQVLVVNNIQFDTERHQMRRGAEVDEENVKEVFENIGLSVAVYRNLTRDEIKSAVNKFTQMEFGAAPDMGIVIIMSHGEKVGNRTVIIGSDGNGLEEEWIIEQFNNQTCLLFKNKPKILIFNICRGELVDNLAQFAQHTQCDSACTKKPDIVDEDDRYYSDIMVCHPSVEGFQAHRDTVRGCWYIELLCKVFMENSHNIDVESMLKMIEQGLKTRISEKRTRQTSTFLNIAFKTCFMNPGIYENDGQIVHF